MRTDEAVNKRAHKEGSGILGIVSNLLFLLVEPCSNLLLGFLELYEPKSTAVIFCGRAVFNAVTIKEKLLEYKVEAPSHLPPAETRTFRLVFG